MPSLADDAELTSPAWDTFDPAEIAGDSYVCSRSGFSIWRNIRAGAGGGTLVFVAGTSWNETIPGGSYDPATKKLTKTFAAFEALEGAQIVEIFATSTGVYEVLP